MIAVTMCIFLFLYGLSQKNKAVEAMNKVAVLEETNNKKKLFGKKVKPEANKYGTLEDDCQIALLIAANNLRFVTAAVI